MRPLIKIENISVVYDLGKSNEVWALKDINGEIYPGEYIIFFGPSGCGKSTLLYTIAGLEEPTHGKIYIQGKNISLLSKKEKIIFHRSSIGMIFQAYYLIPSLTVKGNIILPQIFSNKPSKEREKKADELMRRFGIYDYQDRLPSQLSGGQQQRVAIARALMNDPLIVLADEPVGNLDSKNAAVVVSLLNNLNEKDKKTIIHVTHDPRYLSNASRVFYMKDGQIIRVTVNQKKEVVNLPTKGEIPELGKLAQIYPYLSDEKLKARLIMNYLSSPFDISAQEKIEEVINQYLSRKISEKKMQSIFDNPPEKGGLNLYVQRAKDFTKKIVEIAKKMNLITKETYQKPTPIEEKTRQIRHYLLDDYGGELEFSQIERLDKFLSQRILGEIKEEELLRLLDAPFKNGGVGLNRRTAKKFSRKVELILAKL